MASYNRVVLMGNVTRDIQVKYLPSNMAVTEIGLAVNDRRKGPNGDWIDETTFVDITAFGRTAEIAGEFLTKGSPTLIEGRLKLDTWETDGQKRSKLKVICDKLVLLGSRGGRGGGGGGGGGESSNYDEHSSAEPSSAPYSAPVAAAAPKRASVPAAPPPSDDIPF